jgi:hypothetical protein
VLAVRHRCVAGRSLGDRTDDELANERQGQHRGESEPMSFAQRTNAANASHRTTGRGAPASERRGVGSVHDRFPSHRLDRALRTWLRWSTAVLRRRPKPTGLWCCGEKSPVPVRAFRIGPLPST